MYAWWARQGSLPDVPQTLHPTSTLGLLYIGIAPRNSRSSAHLRSRLIAQHIGGNIGSSTFRLGLASLLWEQENWTPRQSASGKFTLSHEDNHALSLWQRENLGLTWAAIPEPWHIEREIVLTLRPPMNREHNTEHPFYETMGSARNRLRSAARVPEQ